MIRILSVIVFSLCCLTQNTQAQGLLTKQASLPCLNKEFAVVAHIARDTSGELNISENEILAGIDSLNRLFAPVCVSFRVCEFRIIDNFQYDNPETQNEWLEMKVKYLQQNRINIFYVNDIPWHPDDCGFTDLEAIADPQQRGGILMKKPCAIDEPRSVVKQMGHFFGLLDTNQGEGEELVNGQNCEEAGDEVCDTPADPYVIGEEITNYINVDLKCRFIWPGQDANGEFYVPDVANVMSYYPDVCKCGFTYGQFQRMVAAYRRGSARYW